MIVEVFFNDRIIKEISERRRVHFCKVPEDPAAKESYRLPIGHDCFEEVRLNLSCSKKPVAVTFTRLSVLSPEEPWKAVGVRKRKKEISVVVRNLRSTAYRLALASIVLEQWEMVH
ncbi:hypothetical protein T459_16695 [Capsicum annuum]|uniref:Uncharacterized protein n=1 Tax=Capsicum annuum TaxID=4072 RepID=A0A2G2Z9F9_CAPAN|nr:hypothetical protein FXO37_32931 [Capsicum annuum]PHT78643.1 hypothetical protein T459_16695 [Capsicum annuum]